MGCLFFYCSHVDKPSGDSFLCNLYMTFRTIAL
jgi:hypothetical protein